MKILLFVLALWAFMSIAPSDGRNVLRYYGPKGTICKKGHHWIVKVKCTNKCKIRHPKAAFEKGGRVRITGRMGKAFRQKKKSCGRNCFCTKTSKPRWNQVFCKNNRGKKITSNRVHFDIWCIKRTTKLRFRAYIRNLKPKMMEKKCATGLTKHVDGVCRKCENGRYHNGGGCAACNCGTEGSKFQTCEDGAGQCDCKDGYKGRDCKTCKDKFYKITSTGVCKPCGCDPRGSDGLNCINDVGTCTCKADVNAASKCDTCNDPAKKLHDDGKCRKCENAMYFDGIRCKACACSVIGSKFHSCETGVATCTCNPGYKNKKCDACEDGYYQDASFVCKACNCVVANTVGGNDKTCGNDGKCNCKGGFTANDCSS